MNFFDVLFFIFTSTFHEKYFLFYCNIKNNMLFIKFKKYPSDKQIKLTLNTQIDILILIFTLLYTQNNLRYFSYAK